MATTDRASWGEFGNGVPYAFIGMSDRTADRCVADSFE
jgi:hypothetical protein